MDYVIETASQADLPRILEIYAYARAFMAQTGNPNQWGTTHPPREQLEEDIARKRLYVVKGNGQIQGVFYFCVEEDPTYAVIHEDAAGNAVARGEKPEKYVLCANVGVAQGSCICKGAVQRRLRLLRKSVAHCYTVPFKGILAHVTRKNMAYTVCCQNT